MNDESAPRTGKWGVVITGGVVGVSFLGVIGWYLVINHKGASLDTSGFDMSAVTPSAAPTPRFSAPNPAQPADSLGMLRSDAGVRIMDSNSTGNSGSSSSSGSKAADKKADAHMSFTEAARKYEATVRRFGERMSAKYPVLRRYGKEWMKHPDLKKLNDDFQRDKDPIKFMMGLSKSPSFPAMFKKYAAEPAMREFVMQGFKESPPELTSAAGDVLQNDRVVKDLVSSVAGGMGLPASITSFLGGGGDPSKVDQNKLMGDVMKSPDMQKALQQQNAPAVSLPNRH